MHGSKIATKYGPKMRLSELSFLGSGLAVCLRSLNFRQSLFQVGDQIFGVFQSDAERQKHVGLQE